MQKEPVPKAISSPFSLNKEDWAKNIRFDLNFNIPFANILPLETGLVIWILNEVVKQNTSWTIELTAQNAASSNNLK